MPPPPVDDFLQFLVDTPLLLLPILLVAAFILWAVLKRLLKLAAILALAGVLYVLLVEYVSTGS